MLRALTDAQAAGCDTVALSTDVSNEARALYTSLGFDALYETQMWTQPA